MWTYGYGFILANEAESGFYAPTSSLIDSPPYTREPGIWGYNEVHCDTEGVEICKKMREI